MHLSRILRVVLAGAAFLLVAACGSDNGTVDNGSNNNPGGSAACDLGNATAVTHTTNPVGAETWASGVHRVPASLTVPVGGTLTIAACSRVEFGNDAGLTVNGALVSAGTETAPVDFVNANAGAHWGTIRLNLGGSADLAWTTLTHGGGSAALSASDVLGAALYALGRGDTPLKVAHVGVAGAAGIGVALVNAGFAAGSTALTVSGAGANPMYLGADMLGTLPDGQYNGNGVDTIALQSAYFSVQDNQRPILADTHIRNPGVPYCVGLVQAAEIVVGAAGHAAPLVTIDPGVEILFRRGSSAAGRLRVVANFAPNPTQALGAVAAAGTAAAPVHFGSCETVPAPGDWIGLQLNGLDARTSLDNVTLTDAGADSGVVGTCLTHGSSHDADAALQVQFSLGAPDRSPLTNSRITGSAGNGIYRGWQGPDLDMLGANSVSGVAWCSQTLVPDTSNACPPVPCPAAP